jgi:hypothetical protein
MFSVPWEERAKLMVEFSMNAESGWTATSSIDGVVNLDFERCEGKGGIVLTDVFTKALSFWS